MALADITSRLYQSAAYRNTSVVKALADSVKISLKMRFSLVGMAATLTGSQTLYSIAQQKYGISKEEKKQEEKDMQFKQHVVNSISTLTKQVALLESITEKNSSMINLIMTDLGYFKGQRKVNPMSFAGQVSAVRVPIRSKTVKGKIDRINEEIQILKGIRTQSAQFSKIKEERDRRKKEQERNKALIAAATVGTLGALGIKALGAGAGVAGIGGLALGGATALISSAAAQQMVKKIIGTAIPVVGKAFKLSLLYQLGVNVYERQKKRTQTGMGIQTGDESDYINRYDPVRQPNEWNLKNQEITLRRNWDKLLEGAVAPIDSALTGILGFLALKYGADAINSISKITKKGAGAIATGRFRGILSSTIGSTGVAAAAAGIGAAAGASASRFRAPGVSTGAISGGRIRKGNMWVTLPGEGTPMGAAPKSTRIKRFVPKSVKIGLMKMQRWAKGIAGGATKTGAAGVAILGVTILDMYQAANSYEKGFIEYDEYKQRMTSGWKGIIDVVGIGGVSAALGGMVGGPLGFVAGAVGGVAASFALDDQTTWMADKIFAILHDGEAPPSGNEITAANITPQERQNIATRTQAPKEILEKINKDSTFMAEVVRVSEKFNLDPADLLAVMYRESRLDPQAVNRTSGATGLIQFIPKTAKGLGTSVEALRTMTAAEQMKYVEKYLDDAANTMGMPTSGMSRGELYAWVFNPSFAKSGVLAVAGTQAYELNKGLDVNKDNIIDLADLEASTRYDSKTLMAMSRDAAQSYSFGQGRDQNLEASLLSFFMKNAGEVTTPPTASEAAPTADKGLLAANAIADTMLPAIASQQSQINNLAREMRNIQSLVRVDDVQVDNPV